MKEKLLMIKEGGDFDFHKHPISALVEYMKEVGLTEIEVSSIKRICKSNFFYCSINDEIYYHDINIQSCGNNCEYYLPRNGKSGCCKYRHYCYEEDKSYILNIDGKLTKKRNERN